MRNDFLDDAFANADLMTEAVYTNADGVEKKVMVDFVNAEAMITLGIVDVQSGNPTARARTADVGDAVNDCTFLINGITYYVAHHHPLAHGVTLLEFSKDKTK